MKQYEYVRLHISKFVGAESKEHRQIIDEYAERAIVMLATFQQISQTMERSRI